MAETKLYRLSRIRKAPAAEGADSVRELRRMTADDRSRGQLILQEAQTYWMAMERYRRERERNKKYLYGYQWSDLVETEDGRWITEERYIKSQGRVPLKNNLIRRLVRNVVGVYRSQATEPTCTARDREEQQQAETMSTVLQYNMQLNRMTEVYARTLEEYLCGGFVVHKKRYKWKRGKMDCWTEYIQPNNVIIDNNMKDFRGWDCSFIGEIHDISREELLSQFAKSPEDYKRLSEIYTATRMLGSNVGSWESFGYSSGRYSVDFLAPRDESRCRVIEVWRKESKPRYRCHDWLKGTLYPIDTEDYGVLVAAENARRLAQGRANGIPDEEVPLIEAEWFIDSYWYYYYLTPFGDIIDEGETPYAHKSHPYVFKAYPFIDGEIHSFVSDVIDQQRYTNRLITMQDWIISASAKGALLVPEDCLKGLDPKEFADQWAKFNGVIVYTPSKTGAAPQQVVANSVNIGIHELLQLQLKFFEDISGVNGALQGKAGFSGESGQHAQIMADNAATSLVDLLSSFDEFVRDAAYKDVKNIQQYYDQKRVYNISGRSGANIVYDPLKIRDIEFDFSITPSKATPAYRARANETLLMLFEKQAINVRQLLEFGDFDFADALLQSIDNQERQLAQGQQVEGLPPEVMQQVQAGSDPRAMEMLQRAVAA